MAQKAFNHSRLAKNLARKDKRKGLAEKRKKIVLKKGFSPRSVLDDAGRNLPYYVGVIRQLAKHFPNLKGKTILHLASSTGVLTKYLQDRQAFAVGMDIDRELLGVAKKLKK
jgi:2-polyprenyl-3-methyl-5-hydroxy-6-metoxy-1,4-benzoquinol methylase